MLRGTVIKGDGYGRKIGFPTVNLGGVEGDIPKDGVYAGFATIEGDEYRAGIVVSPEGEKKKVEAHLIGYNRDAYGKTVTLETVKYLREYRQFKTEEELIAQIKLDIKQC